MLTECGRGAGKLLSAYVKLAALKMGRVEVGRHPRVVLTPQLVIAPTGRSIDWMHVAHLM